MAETTVGTVYLVGAGPGDPGLLTRAGAEALSTADAVVYDRLASPALLALAREDAALTYVGKAAGEHTMRQPEINALLVELAQAGKTVCRLKGGDPFVFGRGGEEALALRAHGIPVVIIPGVSSAVAVPAYAGIPVTDRRYASSFSVITGHEDPTKAESSLDWERLAHGADTLVFLMGLGNLTHIARELMRQGRAARTPVAVIQQGTTPHQRVVVGALTDIADLVAAAQLESPAVTVVGDVVRLREELAWYDVRPLFGKRVLVTRARTQASELACRLAAAGAEPVEYPTIRIEPLPPASDLLGRLYGADWVVFTSANALPMLLGQLATLGADIRALGRAKLAAIGPATAESLRACGLHVDYVPERFIAEAVADGFPAPEGQQIVIARAEEAREILPDLLAARGAVVDVIPVYRTIPEDGPPPDLAGIDVITFTSASTVHHFCARYPEAVTGPVIACIGPITAEAARDLGLSVQVVAEEHTIPGLIQALERYFGQCG